MGAAMFSSCTVAFKCCIQVGLEAVCECFLVTTGGYAMCFQLLFEVVHCHIDEIA